MPLSGLIDADALTLIERFRGSQAPAWEPRNRNGSILAPLIPTFSPQKTGWRRGKPLRRGYFCWASHAQPNLPFCCRDQSATRPAVCLLDSGFWILDSGFWILDSDFPLTPASASAAHSPSVGSPSPWSPSSPGRQRTRRALHFPPGIFPPRPDSPR